MNTITTFAGNLTADPELRFTASGKPVANFTVGVNRRTQDSEGNWTDAPTTFHDVKVWGPQAENIAESLLQGHEAVVVGQVETETWKNKDGENRRRQVVVVSERFGAVGASLRYATAQITKATKNNRPGRAATPTTEQEPVSEPPF